MFKTFRSFILLLIFSLNSYAHDILPFNLGVRSGDPSSDGVILWTQLNPDYFKQLMAEEFLKLSKSESYDSSQSYRASNKVDVQLQVALDNKFTSLIHQEVLTVTPAYGYTVRADLSGRLAPDTRYYYRFVVREHTSRTGKTKTLPDKNSKRKITIAVLSCQDYSTGYFNVHKVLSRWSDHIDAVFFNGDFIYEYDKYDSRFANIVRNNLSLPSGSKSAITEEDFRYLYRAYLSDAQLQESLASLPFFMIHDDHETGDNQFWNRDTLKMDLPGERYKGLSSPERQRVVLNARKALYDYTPIRAEVDVTKEDPQQFIKLFRSVRLGALADFIITDGRSYRDGAGIRDDDQSKTMLGAEQKNWFTDQLFRCSASDTHWCLWGNQVMFSRMALLGGNSRFIPDYLHNSDQWNGFLHEREEIKSLIEKWNINNLVVVTGDMHTSLISYIQPSDRNSAKSNIGVEFMTPSITSPNLMEELGPIGDFPPLMSLVDQMIKDQNNHLAHFNSKKHGFALLTLSEDAVNWEVFDVPTDKYYENPKEQLMIHMKYKNGSLHYFMNPLVENRNNHETTPEHDEF